MKRKILRTAILENPEGEAIQIQLVERTDRDFKTDNVLYVRGKGEIVPFMWYYDLAIAAHALRGWVVLRHRNSNQNWIDIRKPSAPSGPSKLAVERALEQLKAELESPEFIEAVWEGLND